MLTKIATPRLGRVGGAQSTESSRVELDSHHVRSRSSHGWL